MYHLKKCKQPFTSILWMQQVPRVLTNQALQNERTRQARLSVTRICPYTPGKRSKIKNHLCSAGQNLLFLWFLIQPVACFRRSVDKIERNNKRCVTRDSPRVKNEEGLGRVVNQPDPNQNPLACPRTKEAVFICRSREQLISQSKYGARILTLQQIFLLAFTSHTIRFAST